MAEKSKCTKPGCAGEVVGGVCAECEKRKKENTGRLGSVGFGMSELQRKPSPPGNGRGGWGN